MINAVTLIGRLGRDPELKTSESGTSIVNFPLAFHEYRQNNGERKTVTHWFNCCAFGSLAEICSEFIHKGSRIGIHGQLRQSNWETKEGDKRSSVEILVRDIEFLSTNGTSTEVKED
ncbi:single-stranded DNA-binding protein [bacterium]|nr:single-stranded DNA-binding protein [candidate division CSSED10-310 bacterium]